MAKKFCTEFRLKGTTPKPEWKPHKRYATEKDREQALSRLEQDPHFEYRTAR